jgi:hypothetical protein
MNQFFYEREEPRSGKDGKPVMVKFIDSFDMSRVIRSFEYSPGLLVILLDDGHEETRKVPVTNNQGKVTGVQNSREYMQSELRLSERDSMRFRVACGFDPMEFPVTEPRPIEEPVVQPTLFPVEAE